MISHRYRRYERQCFMEWKGRVRLRLPGIVAKFYEKEPSDYSKHVLLGSVIQDINNPFYGFMNDGKIVSDNQRVALIVLLEINVETLFNYVHKLQQ